MNKMESIPSPGTRAVPLWNVAPARRMERGFLLAEEKGEQPRWEQWGRNCLTV